jgi:ribose transport system substrate-binding protein
MQTIQINNAFAEELDSKYAFLDRQDCDFKAEVAMTKMTDMLTAYGVKSQGGEIECIVSHDGGMLTGVMSALEAAGLKPGSVTIIAMGSNQVLYDAMASGWLSACSTQDPNEEAKLAVETLFGVINGTATPGWTKLPTPVAYPDTKDNFKWFK